MQKPSKEKIVSAYSSLVKDYGGKRLLASAFLSGKRRFRLITGGEGIGLLGLHFSRMPDMYPIARPKKFLTKSYYIASQNWL
jgi:hypothetical protein